MDGHLGYEKSEQSDNDDCRNGNVASRIEYLCKEYNCDLLLSETTVESTEINFHVKQNKV